jgi:hypothetical protein
MKYCCAEKDKYGFCKHTDAAPPTQEAEGVADCKTFCKLFAEAKQRDSYYEEKCKVCPKATQLERLTSRDKEARELVKECLDCMCDNEIPYSDYVKELHGRIQAYLNREDVG